MRIDKSGPVLVTGATGYVAGWLVKELLREGFEVHAAVRDAKRTDKLKYLTQVEADLPGSIVYFEADLLREGSYAESMAGCEVVFHTASPFKIDVRDPQKDLVDPARLGTRNVLQEVNRTPSVKRVVLTSSVAAIYGDNIDLQQTPNGRFTEDMWNTTSSLSHQPYSYSKTVAEKEAWKICQEQDRWDLVVINPSLVVGPGINPYGTSESFSIVAQLGDGSVKQGVPRWGFGVVDVRDVAKAHVRAAFTPEAKGRYIISGYNTDLVEMAANLLEEFGEEYPIPRKKMPKWLVWLAAPLVNKAMTRKMVTRNVDHPVVLDHEKSLRELGMTYRPLKESIVEFFGQIVDSERLKN